MRLFRRIIPRLTRASAVTAVTLALTIPLSGAPTLLPARAAGSIVYQQYAAAMARVFAYRVTVDEQVGTGTAQATSVVHLVMDVIRKGKVSQMDAQVTVSAGPVQEFTAEEVSTGTHVCVKLTQLPVWNCQSQSLPGMSLKDLNPANFLQQAGGASVEFKSVGRKTVAGAPSSGYALYGGKIAAMGFHGTIWLDTANYRVSEFDWTEKVQNAQAVSLKMVFSHYNDTSLHIPSVPAS